VGRWLPELLTRHGEEIVEKLAVLGDTDGKPPPAWVVNARSEHFDVFYSDPTLEPSLVPGNELLVKRLLDEMTKTPHAFPANAGLPAWVESWFRNAGKRKKARFADDFAALCDDDPGALLIPDHLSAVLGFVWDGFVPDIAQRPQSDPDDGTGAEKDLG
jgi:putative ATP-dependent endonuclease of OLD family